MAGEGHGHLSEAMLVRFFRSELSRRDTARLVEHLLSQCPQCLKTAVEVGGREGFLFTDQGEFRPAGYPADPDLAFLQALRGGDEEQMRLAQERLRGIGLLAELEGHPPQERSARIRKDARFHSWGLFDRLLAKYPEASRNDPAAGVEMVQLALAVVETLDPARYSPELLADFRTGAFAALGNARRLAGDFEGARTALRRAQEMLPLGTGDPLEEANLISMEASLFRDLGRFEASAASLDRAIEIYREVGDDNLWARALIKQANALGYVEPARGVALLQEALGLLDPAEEPRLELCARHNLIVFLDDDGRPQEALALLELSRPLYRVFADSWTQLRLHWVEGRIALSLGHLAEAEATFRKVGQAFETKGFPYELTLVSIDLAEVYCAQGKWQSAVQLVEGFYPVLERWGMHAEGLAVWLLFRNSVVEHARAQAALDAAAFRAAALYYHRAWRSPLAEPDSRPVS